MSEIMTPIPFDRLINWMLAEYQTQNSVFGVKKERFYKNHSAKKYQIFGRELGSPIGAAAGPNTQLAQNLVAGYVSGLRFIELKTVQTMDGEEMRKCIARPCINAQDEGYNVEWSTELTVEEAFAEYVKGWFALNVAAREFGISMSPDCIFNMSVGYTYEGITSPKIDGFISNMADAKDTEVFRECREYLLANLSSFGHIDADYIENISSHISESITLSTLHGCPPAEIEKIAKHFLTVKKLHTYIKCNPTLLGYDFVRNLLDAMGYSYVSFDHRHFDADLKFADAAVLIERLRNLANEQGLAFGVKLTNTFPVQIKAGELPGEFMYMSGRALFPLSINVAKKLSQAFKGTLPISFSGGADYFNVDKLIRVGIAPVTVATTILKPGGYARARQISEKVEKLANGPFSGINLPALEELADHVAEDRHLVKWAREVKSRKMKSTLPLFDCFTAPCSTGGCPIQQQIPEYLALVAAGEYDRAFGVIAIDNPLPTITSEICNHVCQSKCTRLDYDEPLRIRSAKNTAVRHAQ
ncbi:MAG: putative selenate reductase subunit YgfK, partial [Eubacteriales bacterium]